MHSFHRSQGRILFEVFCAFAISASCVGAWVQTGASALLAIAPIALLYGLVHAFDLARRGSAEEPPHIDLATEEKGDRIAHQNVGELQVMAEQPPATDSAIEEAEIVEPAPPPSREGRRAKAPLKGTARRARASKRPKAMQPELLEETQVAALLRSVEAEAAEPASADEHDVAMPEEADHVPVVPLFEPEPFVRQQRAVFGRKAG